MSPASSIGSVTSRQGYRAGASSYDTAPNPILSLERRFLEPLLPTAQGLDVVDLGCGTGRWLEILRTSSPNSLVGVDISREMLRRAKKKLKSIARLLCSDATAVQLAPSSADLVLGNIMLSYIADLDTFLWNVRDVLREDGSLFLTDVHPVTSAELEWRRGIQAEDGFQQIRTRLRSIESVVARCETAGFKLCARVEPCFGEQERETFSLSGKLKSFEQAIGHPAIYILQFRPATSSKARFSLSAAGETTTAILNASLAISPQESIQGPLTITGTRIETMGARIDPELISGYSNSVINLSGYLLLPGLVNAHDHLEFALFPRLGRGNYANCTEWAEDIHQTHSEIIAQHRRIPKDVRLWWGGIRNVLCGVTTVSHHNPYAPETFDDNFIVRVVREYSWAHSLSMDSEVADKKRRTPAGRPFLVHLAEGVDEKSEGEALELSQAGVLDQDTVAIHGLALNERGRQLLRDSLAGLVWCPSSNVFLFGKTLTSADVHSLPRVAIGSDSPLTGEGDLLDEVRFAQSNSQIAAQVLYGYVTRQAAQILRLGEGQGTLRVGGLADLMAVREGFRSPAQALETLTYKDVELVLVGGRVHLASEKVLQRMPENARSGLQALMIDGMVRWIRAPLERLFAETAGHLPDGIFLGGRRVILGIR
jgi:cytosine/adenosine deaminase-related metal-dependent hydrolase/ubiquinone/menaquinone biosynthesis C-methylase UbiE